MHNTRVRSSWVNGTTMLTTEWAKFDLNLAQALNGVDGGFWAPQNQITINGSSGISVVCPLILEHSAQFLPSGTSFVVLDDNDFPTYSPTHLGRQRTIVYPCMLGKGYPRVAWRPRFFDGGMQAVAGTVDISDGNGPLPVRLIVPLRCHDGATLTSVTLHFRVGFAHKDLPPTMPKARVVRMSNANSEKLAPMTSVAAGATGDDGFVQVTKPATVALWMGAQSLEMVCDQNNVIDLSQFDYYVEIFEETGLTGYPWSLLVKPAVGAASTTNLTSDSPVDGVTNPTTYLAKQQTNSQLNGVYAHGGGAAPGYSHAEDMPQGVVIPVDEGDANGGTYFQMSSNIQQWSGIPTTAGDVPTWKALTEYGFLSYVIPTPAHSTGFLYAQVSSTAVSTGSTEPTWPTVIGTSVTDGTVEWACISELQRTPTNYVGRAQEDDETPQNAGFGFFAHGNIYQSLEAHFEGIVDGRFQ